MKFLFSFYLGALFFSLNFQQEEIPSAKHGVTYGKKITFQNAIQVSELNQRLFSQSLFTGKVEGKVVEVCRKKGCFMKLVRENGEPVMVTFQDYAIFMPQDIVGRTVVVAGTAVRKETSVEQLRHFAQDAGKSREEREKITQPKHVIVITADGVLVVK